MPRALFYHVLRSVRRHPTSAAINLMGLAVGLAACLLLGLYVRHELSYDRFHEKADRLARVVRTEGAATSSAPMAPALERTRSEVEAAVRMVQDEGLVLRPGEGEQHVNATGLFVEPAFFRLFSFEQIRGASESVMSAPDDVVVTESTARQVFGTTDVVGRTLRSGEADRPFTITGVAADPPATSHLQFDLLLPFQLIAEESPRMNNWATNWLFTYVLLSENTSPEELDANLPALFEEHTGEARSSWRVQPMTDVHLHSGHFEYDLATPGSMAYVLLFATVALLILGVACINYVNLATARATRRAMEVGLRKALGADRGHLVLQFLGEAFLVTLVALLLAVGLAGLAAPVYTQLTGIPLAAAVAQEPGPLVAGLGGLWLVVGLAAGGYPSFVLARYEPAQVLRRRPDAPHGLWLRRSLVVGQLVVSIALIAGSVVVREQLAYVQNQHLGGRGEQIVSLPLGEGEGRATRGKTLRRELRRHPGVREVSLTGSVPGTAVSDFQYRLEGQPAGDVVIWDTYFVDPQFADVLGLNVVQGRSFSALRGADSTAFVINRAAAETAEATLGEVWSQPLGKALEFYLPGVESWRLDKRGPVIGVVENFAYRSLHHEVGPLVMQVVPGTFDHVLVQVDAERVSETLAFLEEKWTSLADGQSFSYTFLDDQFARLYRTETRMGRLFGVFAGLAIAIACMGLLGMAAFTAERRRKEVGIRKVLGATATQVVGPLSREYAVLVGIATLIAAPLSYAGLRWWLRDFASHADLGPWPFVGAAALVLGVALLTVGTQAWRAARLDPATTLRDE